MDEIANARPHGQTRARSRHKARPWLLPRRPVRRIAFTDSTAYPAAPPSAGAGKTSRGLRPEGLARAATGLGDRNHSGPQANTMSASHLGGQRRLQISKSSLKPRNGPLCHLCEAKGCHAINRRKCVFATLHPRFPLSSRLAPQVLREGFTFETKWGRSGHASAVLLAWRPMRDKMMESTRSKSRTQAI